VALICSGAGIMLLLNCCICFTVNSVKQNRRSHRNSSIIRRSRQRRSVHFSTTLVVPNKSANSRHSQEIETTEFGRNIQQAALTQAAPIQAAPVQAAPVQAAPNQRAQKKTRHLQDIEMADLTRNIPPPPNYPAPVLPMNKQRRSVPLKPIAFPDFAPPLTPTTSRWPSLRSLTTRRAPPVPDIHSSTLPRQNQSVRIPCRPAPPPPQSTKTCMQRQAMPIVQSATLPRQNQSANTPCMQAVQSGTLPRQIQSANTPCMQAVQSATLPRQNQSVKTPCMQGQAVPIDQNSAFPRIAGKRSRNDDLAKNPLFQKCLLKNSN
jgi:hypothetical protein